MLHLIQRATWRSMAAVLGAPGLLVLFSASVLCRRPRLQHRVEGLLRAHPARGEAER